MTYYPISIYVIITFSIPLHLLVAPRGEMRKGGRREGGRGAGKGREARYLTKKKEEEGGRKKLHTSPEEKGEKRRETLHQGREGETRSWPGKGEERHKSSRWEGKTGAHEEEERKE